ncbi:NAD(P)H-hydrate epimerase [Plantibacter sp. Mn2098]|uniref:NAD(P)H-hydrate epimerase n=1 Tax=Plantibacter sp. Mn2098 TaxID=3395266 RepID=UPI003BC4BB28
MIDGYAAAQVRAAEAPLIAAGVPLMQRAAAGLAVELRELLVKRLRDRDAADGDSGRIVLLVGSGDNGGDALYAGATLASGGAEVIVVRTSARVHADALSAALSAGARQAAGAPADPEVALAATTGADIVVDGIIGTGTSPDPTLRGAAREIVEALLPVVQSPHGPLVVAVDLPSGIDADEGTVPDGAVLPAEVTVTFGAVKAGLLIPPGAGFAGDVRLVDIGLGPSLADVEPLVRVAREL